MRPVEQRWRDILWQEWWTTEDDALAEQLFNALADTPTDWWSVLILSARSALSGAFFGLLIGLGVLAIRGEFSDWYMTLAVYSGCGALVGVLGMVGVAALFRNRLTWRVWFRSWMPLVRGETKLQTWMYVQLGSVAGLAVGIGASGLMFTGGSDAVVLTSDFVLRVGLLGALVGGLWCRMWRGNLFGMVLGAAAGGEVGAVVIAWVGSMELWRTVLGLGAEVGFVVGIVRGVIGFLQDVIESIWDVIESGEVGASVGFVLGAGMGAGVVGFVLEAGVDAEKGLMLSARVVGVLIELVVACVLGVLFAAGSALFAFYGAAGGALGGAVMDAVIGFLLGKGAVAWMWALLGAAVILSISAYLALSRIEDSNSPRGLVQLFLHIPFIRVVWEMNRATPLRHEDARRLRWLGRWRHAPPLLTELEQAMRFAPDPFPTLLHQLEDARTQNLPAQVWISHLLSSDYQQRFVARHTLVTLGGEAVEPLIRSVRDLSRLERTGQRILQAIAHDTAQRFALYSDRFFCPRCLVRFHRHTVSLGQRSFNFYGCRYCRQSREFLTVSRSVAVLNKPMAGEYVLQDGVLRVNWLQRGELFDFDEVEIAQASDEAVERFCIQVGNDEDVVRRGRQRRMVCRVVAISGLRVDTLNKLRSVFGTVVTS